MNSLTEFTGSTMDSREIAGLTGRKHKSVLKTIRNILNELNSVALDGAANFESTFIDDTGHVQPCFQLPKRECLILATGFNIKLRAAIIDRWSELESGKAKPFGINPQTPIDMFHEDLVSKMKTINILFGDVASGVKVATALESQLSIAQKTGVTIDLPEYVKQLQVESDEVTFDENIDTAFASKVAIGSNSTNVTHWKKQYQHITPTIINDTLIKLGFAFRLNKSQVTPTNKGKEFCHTAIAATGYNVGKELVKGWKLDDKRFTDVVFPVLNELEDYLHQLWIINKKR